MSLQIEPPMPTNPLPHDLEAERAVLAAVMLDNAFLDQVNERLDPTDFFLEGHRSILQFMNDLASDGTRIDRASLQAALTGRGLPFEKTGLTALLAFVDNVPRLANLEPYARIIKRKAEERQFLRWLDSAHTRITEGEAYGKVIADAERFLTHCKRQPGQGIKGFYPSLAEFFSADIREPEAIIAGLRRGEVAELAAVTNQGKSTLLLNLSLSLAGGEAYLPLLPESAAPRRVIYIDCESPASRLRRDLQVMARQLSDSQSVQENLMPVVDAEIDGEPLNLRREAHLLYIETVAKDFHADLLVIDTVSSAFELLNENDNAEITRRVMNPLKLLARRLNCAVIFAHHIGKANENQTSERAYRGRGGSALGGLASTVYMMEQDRKHDRGYSILTCAKSKGKMPEPALLRLDFESRWFAVCGERPQPKSQMPTVEEIAEFVATQGAAHTEEILNHFADRASLRKLADLIKEASLLRLIGKANQKAAWRFCTPAKAGSGADGVRVIFTEDMAFLQSARPIDNAETQKYIILDEKVPGKCRCGAEGIRFTNCEVCGKFVD